MNAYDLLPPVCRARDYHIYDRKRRYLDLWQEGGRALLGHRGGRAKTEFKRRLDKGLLAAYPSPATKRLERALSDMLPGRRTFRWYSDRSTLWAAVSESVAGAAAPAVVDPAVDDGASEVMYWRPFLESRSAEARVVFPVVPMPGTGWLSFVAFEREFPADFRPSDPVSPALLEAIRRSIYDLASFASSLDRRVWEAFDADMWTRRGPYLTLRPNIGDFRSLFRDFLDHGIILSPEPTAPSIAPAVFDAGEIRYLRQIG